MIIIYSILLLVAACRHGGLLIVADRTASFLKICVFIILFAYSINHLEIFGGQLIWKMQYVHHVQVPKTHFSGEVIFGTTVIQSFRLTVYTSC